MWNGSIAPSWKKSFNDHFKIIRASKNPITGEYEVVVEFEKTPGREYTFFIDEERYSPDKDSIGREILNQLGEQ
jgi:hypothetical protein